MAILIGMHRSLHFSIVACVFKLDDFLLEYSQSARRICHIVSFCYDLCSMPWQRNDMCTQGSENNSH